MPRSSDKHRALDAMIVVIAVATLATSTHALAENWPQWRGPRGNSTSAESGLPVAWNPRLKIAWKAPLPAWGTSTPAIWGNSLFVTTQHDDELLVLKFDCRAGQLAWSRKVGTAVTPRSGPKRDKQVFHRLHDLATPSPVTDGRSVVVHFGNGVLATYDFAGKLRWRRNLQQDYGAYTIWWGHANSPGFACRTRCPTSPTSRRQAIWSRTICRRAKSAGNRRE